ncbi:MAG TPA: HipA family kinase [Thermoanaerobaculia bacterium]|nr:HipA family kinase [Thermoanaerobaculia bacterium]
MIRTVTATEYVTPLREGGSLPAIVAADDDGTYVVKFRGAGQGVKALIAELISGEIARVLGLRVPEIVFAQIDARLAKTEPDPEIQDLLRASAGLNLALDYLPGSITFDPLAECAAAIAKQPRLASSIVWLDALVTNVDRTAKNTNLLIWHRNLWLIDHGATLIFHHAWSDYLERAKAPFARVSDHVLLPWANEILEVDADFAPLLTRDVVERIVALIPDEWLGEPPFASVDEHRHAYIEVLQRRLASPRVWVEEAARARTARV